MSTSPTLLGHVNNTRYNHICTSTAASQLHSTRTVCGVGERTNRKETSQLQTTCNIADAMLAVNAVGAANLGPPAVTVYAAPQHPAHLVANFHTRPCQQYTCTDQSHRHCPPSRQLSCVPPKGATPSCTCSRVTPSNCLRAFNAVPKCLQGLDSHAVACPCGVVLQGLHGGPPALSAHCNMCCIRPATCRQHMRQHPTAAPALRLLSLDGQTQTCAT